MSLQGISNERNSNSRMRISSSLTRLRLAIVSLTALLLLKSTSAVDLNKAAMLGAFPVPPECGIETNTCSTLQDHSVVVLQQKYRNWIARKFYGARFTVSKLAIEDPSDNSVVEVDFSNSRCVVEKASAEQETYIENTVTCEKPIEHITLVLQSRMYKKDAEITFGDQTGRITAGEVKVLYSVISSKAGTAGDANKRLTLLTELDYYFPSHWWELLLSGFNDNSAKARSDLLVYDESNNFVATVDVNAIFRLQLANMPGVHLCTNVTHCATSAVTATTVVANASKIVEADLFGKMSLPTHVEMTWAWTGMSGAMHFDPNLKMSKGKLTSGWLNTWALFLGLSITLGVILLLICPCMCCICCFFCKCCSCIKDILCCCCKK
eukprot:Filipodium_phascolosomae@DN1821_c0_g1_i1.p1